MRRACRARSPGEKIAGDDDADRLAVRVARDDAGANQLAAGIERLVRLRIGAAGRHPRRQPIRRRAHVPARQRRRLEREDRHDVGSRARSTGSQPVDLDHADAPVGDGRRDRRLQRREVAAQQSPAPATAAAMRVAWLATAASRSR